MASSIFYFGEIGVNDYIFALFSNRTAELAMSLVPDIVTVTRSALTVTDLHQQFNTLINRITPTLTNQLCIAYFSCSTYAGCDRRWSKVGGGDGDAPARV